MKNNPALLKAESKGGGKSAAALEDLVKEDKKEQRRKKATGLSFYGIYLEFEPSIHCVNG